MVRDFVGAGRLNLGGSGRSSGLGSLGELEVSFNPKDAKNKIEEVFKMDFKPEVHAAATADARLLLAYSLCNQCAATTIMHNAAEAGRPFYRRPTPKPDTSSLQSQTLGASADALEAVLNYAWNAPAQDKTLALAQVVVPVLKPVLVASGLERLRTTEGVTDAVTAALKAVYGDVLQEKLGEAGGSMYLLLGAALSQPRAQEKILGLLVQEYGDKLVDTIEHVKKDDVSGTLRNWSGQIRGNMRWSAKAIGPLREFAGICSSGCGYNGRCEQAKGKLSTAREALDAYRQSRDDFKRDGANLISYPLDVLASVIDTASTTEFDVVKGGAVLALKQKLAELSYR